MAETFRLSTGIPKYTQISHWLIEMIEIGRYGLHERLPSELRLSELFRVNRNTVRQAISDLVAKGLVQKRNGVGSFVVARSVPPVKYTLQNISSFTDESIDYFGFLKILPPSSYSPVMKVKPSSISLHASVVLVATLQMNWSSSLNGIS